MHKIAGNGEFAVEANDMGAVHQLAGRLPFIAGPHLNIYNADTLGYRPDLVGRKIESWAELFNTEFKGKTSILDIPSIGIMDAAMVTEAAGLVTYGDKGNMTKEEIDKVTDILKEGDVLDVKVLEVDRAGRIKLSRRVLLTQ